MSPDTILVRANCDLKRLPLDALEGFLLSQLDGQLTLAEVGEIAGLATARATEVAARLVDLGAAEPVGKKRMDPRAEVGTRRPPRIDPRAEKADTIAPRAEPRPKRASVTISASKERRRSTRSLRAARVDTVEPCELDPETEQRILALEKLSLTADHYTLLGVGRDMEKKEIKRAYFELASKLHPDRFFGKKLGHVRIPLERLFMRLTEANDVLSTKSRRAEYDATLPPETPRRSKRPSALQTIETPRPSKRPSAAEMPRSSKRPGAVETSRPSKRPAAVEAARTTRRPSAVETPRPSKRPSRRMSRAMRAAVVAPAVASKPIAVPDDKFRRLQAAGKMLAAQARAAPIVMAGEERLRANDIIGAANNFRLALEIYEDPDVRRKLEAIDAHSRDLRHDASVARARVCERGERWSDAADHYVRANQARADAATAERAANALRVSNGDLRLAATLAEQAVNHDGKNLDYRVTLGEVYFAGGFVLRAATEVETVLARDPQNPRARALEARVKSRG